MTRPIAQCDTECDYDWWLIKFRLPDGRMFSYDICSEQPNKPLDYSAVQWFIDNFEIHTFNGWNYDLPMIRCAMAGYSPRQLKQANDLLIVKRVRPYQLEQYFPQMVSQWDTLDHVDLMDVAPGVHLGLKLLMGRMHCPNLQDLPFDPSKPMPLEMRSVTDTYCGNDLYGTAQLGDEVKTRLALRRAITEKIGVDVRSKSDAQIAEAWFKAKLGRKVWPQHVPHGHQFQYVPPAYLAFSTPLLRDVLSTVRAAWFPVYDVDQVKTDPDDELIGPDGKVIKTGVKMPPELKKLRITIGKSTYQMGIGGLHSTEKAQVVRRIPGVHRLKAPDVRSYYPSLILNSGMYPVAMGPEMLTIYQEIYDGRLSNKDLAARLTKQLDQMIAEDCAPGEDIEACKAQRDRVKSDEGGEKIILNGTFGKLFSKYSILYAPEQGIWVTLTGQLSLLMLIEAMEVHGMSVRSANTDGIVVEVPDALQATYDLVIAWWEQRTGLHMDTGEYEVIYSASVNSYVGVDIKGKLTLKGDFKSTGVDSNGTPAYDIATHAAVQYLAKGVPISATVRGCADVRQFVAVRKVKGGGTYCYTPTSNAATQEHMENVLCSVGWQQTPGRTKTGKPKKGIFWTMPGTRDTLGELPITTDAAYGQHMLQTSERTFLGKVVRWYLSTKSTDCIRDGGSGNKVAGTDGAMPIMRFSPGVPADIDYAAYEAHAKKLIERVGVEA